MRPRWRKVFHDLFGNITRTLLVVFSIAVGVFSIGVIAGAYEIIAHDMSASYAENNPANIELQTADFNDDVLNAVRNSRGVQDAEARRVVSVRVRTPGSTKWVALDVVAFDDFNKNKINLLQPISGKSVPDKREVLLEHDALKDLNVQPGDMLEFQLPDDTITTMRVAGVVQDVAMGAADFLASPYAYITRDSLPYLEQPDLFNRIYATVSTDGDNINHVRDVGVYLKDKLEKNGTPVSSVRFAESHVHPLASTVNAILGILLALGILILFLSSSLIANTLSALLNQHLRHIGVIKLVGGRNLQVLFMYLILILSFGLLALAIAVPLGAQGAYGLAVFIASHLNFNILGYRIVPLAVVIQILVGLVVTLAAGLWPVINGSRITVLRAISGDLAGDENQAKAGQARVPWFDWMMVQATRFLAARGIHIPRPFIISLRNTFRRRSRLLLTLFTLTMGGAIFIAVFNVRVTLNDYIGAISNYFLADVSVSFNQPYRLNEVNQIALQTPGVVRTEGWQFASADLLDANKNVLATLNIFGPPAGSDLVQPIVVQGRWVQVGDEQKIAVSENVLSYYPGLKPGDYLHIKINGKEEDWQVVGIFKFVNREGVLAYTTYDYLAHKNDQANQAASFRVVTDQHNRPYQDHVAELLDANLRSHGLKVLQTEAGRASLDTAVDSLSILVTFLLIMAVLTAIVGAMGLTGTMGMNVLERTREIGIMRAIGADDHAVMRTVIAEGVVIGMISFVLAVILSIPFTYLLSTIVSLAVFETPIDVIFTFAGYGIWLALVLVLSALASIVPARNAARMTIREVLAYE
ncbi:MAG TPA: ABC transporter permease [Anaerolineales bacterium]|nr:ABC transporter permease [Anaerolineales bacterium]